MSLFNEQNESSDFDGAFKTRDRPAGRRRQPRHSDEEDVEEEAPEIVEKPGPKAAKSGWGSIDDGEGAGMNGVEGMGGPTSVSNGGLAPPRPGRRKGIETLETTSSITAADELPKPRRADDVIDETPIIPDLEEELEEDITRQVAAPPRVRNNRVQTIKELDTEIKFSLPAAGESGIDLSILTQTLSPQDQVVEEDVEWKFDELLAEVSADIQAEEDRKEETEGGPKEPEEKQSNAL
mmetsp:Transcript_28/g.53  ORF Transcript_28/g.53 Transcript_28/m.53 type:complete len:237 (-) Transcript_28:460-1170(-)|eukprot:CAMPEP_0184643660 /NCGR_PEP_ID=MMETSP0308-20130426/491_1 /TAXON_ID=38269 /ORGANISM="Gloeochaete witrockiana, Strain SAG 46.84" /LENGTH=236 /DNA_ID=CAMNT_0027071729 /DNA_START=130 /DNA_END=840 /DNA_ORIENTATION=+